MSRGFSICLVKGDRESSRLFIFDLHLLHKFDSMLQYEAAGKGLPHDGKVCNKAAKVGEHLGAAVQADPLARLQEE